MVNQKMPLFQEALYNLRLNTNEPSACVGILNLENVGTVYDFFAPDDYDYNTRIVCSGEFNLSVVVPAESQVIVQLEDVEGLTHDLYFVNDSLSIGSFTASISGIFTKLNIAEVFNYLSVEFAGYKTNLN